MHTLFKWITMLPEQGPFLSIYMPLHPGRKNATQDRIRWRNLLDTAAQKLEAFEWGASDIEKFMQPARALNVDEMPRGGAHALAALVSPNAFDVVTTEFALPELVIAAPHPHLTPLLPLLQQGHCYILTLSQKRVGLWRSDAQETVAVKLPGVPRSLADALADMQFEKVSNVRAQPRAVGGGGQHAIAYGQGGAAEALKDEMTVFFRQVDAGVAHALKGERAPLVVACVDYLFPLYHAVNTYPALHDEFLSGNPDRVAPTTLAARARELLQPLRAQAKRDAQARYHALAATERATDEIKKIVPAAVQGRVELLLFETDILTPGEYDAARQEVLAHPTSAARTQDLCNLAALYTLRAGGTVIPLPRVEMPGAARMAAVLRF